MIFYRFSGFTIWINSFTSNSQICETIKVVRNNLCTHVSKSMLYKILIQSHVSTSILLLLIVTAIILSDESQNSLYLNYNDQSLTLHQPNCFWFFLIPQCPMNIALLLVIIGFSSSSVWNQRHKLLIGILKILEWEVLLVSNNFKISVLVVSYSILAMYFYAQIKFNIRSQVIIMTNFWCICYIYFEIF